MEDTECDLQLAVSWAVSAKNSLKNVHGFLPKSTCFREKSEFPKYM